MQIQIETFSGSILDGVVLTISGTVMRVAISGCEDVVEFRFRGGIWFWEGRAPVEIQIHEKPGGYGPEWFSSLIPVTPARWGAAPAAWIN